MDNQKHQLILQLGVSIWNQWRANEPLTVPSLRNVNLSGMHLEGVNLCRADLRGADLSNAYLYDADFQGANLKGANLHRTALIGANLHRASLVDANLEHAYLAQSDLSNANLSKACLRKANFRTALLTETKLTKALLEEADFTEGYDLTAAQLQVAKGARAAYVDEAVAQALVRRLDAAQINEDIPLIPRKQSSGRPVNAREAARNPTMRLPLGRLAIG